MLFDYDQPSSWPDDVLAFQDCHHDLLEDWFTERLFVSPDQYNAVITQLYQLLRPHEMLAWHNTRLTPSGGLIVAEGMSPPYV